MTTPTLKFCPSAPLEKDDLEQRLERKLNDAIVSKITSTTLKK